MTRRDNEYDFEHNWNTKMETLIDAIEKIQLTLPEPPIKDYNSKPNIR